MRKPSKVKRDRLPWSTRMFVEEIATRIRSAMEEKDVSLFELAAVLRWEPAKLLQWIDGSLASPALSDEEAGPLREMVEIGQALGKQWVNFDVVKAPIKGKNP